MPGNDSVFNCMRKQNNNSNNKVGLGEPQIFKGDSTLDAHLGIQTTHPPVTFSNQRGSLCLLLGWRPAYLACLKPIKTTGKRLLMLTDILLDSELPSPPPEMTAHCLLPLSQHPGSPWFSLRDAASSWQRGR